MEKERKSGPLQKYSGRLKGWQTRVFESDATGVWYRQAGECARFIPLLDADVTVSTSDSRRFDIKLHTHTYKLRAGTAQERRQWLAQLRRIQGQVRGAHGEGTHQPSARMSGPLPASLFPLASSAGVGAGVGVGVVVDVDVADASASRDPLPATLKDRVRLWTQTLPDPPATQDQDQDAEAEAEAEPEQASGPESQPAQEQEQQQQQQQEQQQEQEQQQGEESGLAREADEGLSHLSDTDQASANSTDSADSGGPHGPTSRSFLPRSLRGMDIWRERLPSNRPSTQELGLWELFKDALGKDLTRITIPMTLCEPITFLQRMCEELEYSAALDKAVAIGTSDPFLQLGYVAAFAASICSSTAGRVLKPLNPLLFETYEAIRPDRRFVMLAEQVSHHPPIGVATCISDHGWTLTYDSAILSRFWGKYMEVRPTGLCHLRIPATGDHISWSKACVNVNNVLLSSRWIDYEGDVRIHNHRTGHSCVLRFVRKGWFAGPTFEIKGQVYDPAGVPHLDLFGAWNDALTALPTHPDNKKLDSLDKLQHRDSNVPSLQPKATRLWQAKKRPPHSADQYQFTTFAMQLNEMDPISRDGLCPTDARHRPDIRALEEGDMKRAGDEKTRLEDKQRETRKKRDLKGLPATEPRWFEQQFDPDTKTETWVYKGGYFEARKARAWPSDLPDLY